MAQQRKDPDKKYSIVIKTNLNKIHFQTTTSITTPFTIDILKFGSWCIGVEEKNKS